MASALNTLAQVPEAMGPQYSTMHEDQHPDWDADATGMSLGMTRGEDQDGAPMWRLQNERVEDVPRAGGVLRGCFAGAAAPETRRVPVPWPTDSENAMRTYRTRPNFAPRPNSGYAGDHWNPSDAGWR